VDSKYTQSMWGREAKDRKRRKGWPAVVSTLCLRHALDHPCEAPPTTRPRAGTPVSCLGVVCMSCGDGGASARVALTRQASPAKV